jgi:hypothetical protein
VVGTDIGGHNEGGGGRAEGDGEGCGWWQRHGMEMRTLGAVVAFEMLKNLKTCESFVVTNYSLMVVRSHPLERAGCRFNPCSPVVYSVISSQDQGT